MLDSMFLVIALKMESMFLVIELMESLLLLNTMFGINGAGDCNGGINVVEERNGK